MTVSPKSTQVDDPAPRAKVLPFRPAPPNPLAEMNRAIRRARLLYCDAENPAKIRECLAAAEVGWSMLADLQAMADYVGPEGVEFRAWVTWCESRLTDEARALRGALRKLTPKAEREAAPIIDLAAARAWKAASR